MFDWPAADNINNLSNLSKVRKINSLDVLIRRPGR